MRRLFADTNLVDGQRDKQRVICQSSIDSDCSVESDKQGCIHSRSRDVAEVMEKKTEIAKLSRAINRR